MRCSKNKTGVFLCIRIRIPVKVCDICDLFKRFGASVSGHILHVVDLIYIVRTLFMQNF